MSQSIWHPISLSHEFFFLLKVVVEWFHCKICVLPCMWRVSTTFLKHFIMCNGGKIWNNSLRLQWSYTDNCIGKQSDTYNEWRWSTNINNILEMDALNNNEIDGVGYKHPCTLPTNDHVLRGKEVTYHTSKCWFQLVHCPQW